MVLRIPEKVRFKGRDVEWGYESRLGNRYDIAVLWERYVGPRTLFEDEELRILNDGLRRCRRRQLFWQFYLLYLTSKYWRRIREIVLYRDGYRCVECGSVQGLHVDHLKYPKFYGEEVLEDLRTICVSCHSKKTKRFDMGAWSSKARFVEFNGDMQLFSALRRAKVRV